MILRPRRCTCPWAPTIPLLLAREPSRSHLSTSHSTADKCLHAQATTTQPAKDALQKKKDEIVLEVTPLEKMLQNAGPLREDGSDRFFGFENVCRPPLLISRNLRLTRVDSLATLGTMLCNTFNRRRADSRC